jgi:plastocyanin
MRRVSLIAVSLLAGLTLAACSGSAASPSAAPSAAASAAPSAAPSAAASAPSGGAGASAVTIKNFAFAPADLTVKTGTTVTWTNQDSATHTVTFDSGPTSDGLVNGATYEQTFGTAGTFTYHCRIHASMKGTVTVTN